MTLAPDGRPAIAFQLSHGTKELPAPSSAAEAVVGLVDHDTYPTVAMFVAGRTRGLPLAARVDPHSAEVEALLARREAYFVTFRGQRLVSVAEREWPADHKLLRTLEGFRQKVQATPSFFRWHLLRANIVAALLTQADRAAIGWMEAWDAALFDARASLQQVKKALEQGQASDGPLPEPYNRIVDALISNDDPLIDVVPIVIDEVKRDGATTMLRTVESPIAKTLQAALVTLAADSPPATREGQAFSAIQWRAPHASIVPVPLDLDVIEKRVGFAEFWYRLPTGWRTNWDRFVRGDDIAAALDVLEDGFKAADLVEDAEEALASASALLREATRDRQWTIPPRAIVDFRLGPFVRAEVLDLTSHVVFMCRTAQWHYHPIVIDIRDGHVAEGLSYMFEESGDHARAVRLEATIAVLLASIVRDFLVVEDRSAVFGRSTEAPHRTAKNGGASSEPVVVYLPRVRYASRPDVARLTREIPLDRRAHDVSAHLRRSQHISPTQRALAAFHGWTIPEGFTFVRPHRRGTHEVDVIYRSRSALHALYTLAENERRDRPAVPDDWFEFERLVRGALRARGLRYEEVQQLGDDGIAVLAIDDRDADHGLWLVHAFAGPRVGPSLVERHASALRAAPPGTRRLVISLGALTSAARALAADAGIVVADQVASK